MKELTIAGKAAGNLKIYVNLTKSRNEIFAEWECAREAFTRFWIEATKLISNRGFCCKTSGASVILNNCN